MEFFADFIFEFWFKDQEPEDLDGAKFEGINIVTKDVTGRYFSIHFVVLNNRWFVLMPIVEEEADLFWLYIAGGCIAMIILIIIVLVYCRVKGEKQIQAEVIE